jgi:hypothetical protein
MIHKRLLIVLALVVLTISGCTGSNTTNPMVTPHTPIDLTPNITGVTATPFAIQPTPTTKRTIILPPDDVPPSLVGPAPEKAYGRLPFSPDQWKTNFQKTLVDFDLIVHGPRRNTVPPIYAPGSITINEAEEQLFWLKDNHPVISVNINGIAKAYPLGIMIHHQVVNDSLDDTPIVISYSPLCNSATGFKRIINDHELEFGTSGNLFYSNTLLWDHTTESWWPQITGHAIIGDAAGLELSFIPVQIISWKDFKQTYTNGTVLPPSTMNPELIGSYGNTPYLRYDAPNSKPELFRGTIDNMLSPKERILGIEIGEDHIAIPFTRLKASQVIHHDQRSNSIVAFHKKGTASALDKEFISNSKDVGSATVFSSIIDGNLLKFTADKNGYFIDDRTSSTWDITGVAIDGNLKGRALQPVKFQESFWFSWSSFYPNTTILGGNKSTK